MNWIYSQIMPLHKTFEIMKKYKTSIEVKGENVKALFDCPVVTDIKKATSAVDDGVDVADMLYSVTAVTLSGSHKQVKRGAVLAQDVCDHWEIMTAEEWELHKDETIEDDTSESDSSSEESDASASGSEPDENSEA